MSTKKYFYRFISILLLLVLFTTIFMFVYDPIFRYHKPYIKYQNINSELYQNTGIARNFDYDSVIIGSSMVENMRPSWFDEKFNSKTVKLSYSGAYVENYRIIFSQIFSKGHQVKNVFFSLDNYLFTGPTNEESFEIPKWVKSNISFEDANYLLNKEMILKYLPNLLQKKEINLDVYYEWANNFSYGKEYALAGFDFVEQSKEVPVVDWNKVNKNFEIIENYIQTEKETDFYIFIPPYSIVYWYDQWQTNNLNNTIDIQIYIYGKLLEYDNVHMIYFQDNKNIVENLEYYKDYSHYNQDVSKFIINNLDNRDEQLQKYNYKEMIESWRNHLLNYDYSQLWS